MSPDLLKPLMDAVPMPLVLIGRNERVVVANASADGLFGVLENDRHYATVLRQPALLDCIEAALRGDTQQESQFVRRDATRDTTYRALAAPVRIDGRDGILLSLEDIGHVEAAGQMRRDFVANVSHELRTPLTAVLGFIETLQGPAREDSAAQDRFLEMMQREASRMSRLIQDLLSLSRVEATERQRPTGRIDVAALVTSASMTLGPLVRETGVTLDVRGADEAVEIPGDADQILQVITNLTENAIKYGGSSVTVELFAPERDPVLRATAVRIEVRDDGDGIDPIHIPRLTERFYRVDNHRSREMGGTGLGLAIVKHIVNRHRGRMRVESKAGQGSRFVVVLPHATGEGAVLGG
ncbi:MAG: ATP-binding protein [Rhodobacter sp.]|nr:ATP-binding protein [Rhodobacter sp.]